MNGEHASSTIKNITTSAFSKVPAATAGFWVIKIIATTLGEVGGNEVSMNLGLGYLAATFVLAGVFLAMTFFQIRAHRFHPWLYWAAILASTTAGTTLADYATRSIGIGYTGGSLLLLELVLASLIAWRLDIGAVSADDIADRRSESYYWLTITFSQTLGTALGDWFADVAGLGYAGSTAVIARRWSCSCSCTRGASGARWCCSGRRSCSRARWVRCSATCSTSPPRAGAWA